MFLNHWPFFVLTFCFFIHFSNNLRAQDTSTADFQSWNDVTLIHHLNEKWRFSGDLGIRGIFTTKDWTQLYARPTMVRRLTPSLDARAGVSIFQTWNKQLPNQTELRFHQEVNLKWPYVAGFIFKHMVRFEERFFFNQGFENDFSFRVRYRPWMETPDFRLIGKEKKMYGIASIDLFFPLGNSASELFVNNYRIIAGIGHRTSEKLRIELHYFWQRSKAFTDEGFKTSENVLRVRFFLQLNEPPGK